MTGLGHNDALVPLRGTGRFYPVPARKIMFTSVAKNACTSVKWMLAEIAGEDPARLRPTTGYDPTRAAGVHDRTLWAHVPRLEDLTPAERAEIHPDNGWFVFGLTRDPRLRMFSSWQSKYLLANPATLRRRPRRELLPRVPESAEDVIADFAAFAERFAADPKAPAFAGDPHFRTQVGALAPRLVPYSRIYDVSQMGELVADLNAHLEAQGHPGDVAPRKFNDSPLRAGSSVFENGVKELIESAYARDFEEFGDRWSDSAIESRELDWTPESFAHVRSIVEANERIYDLVTISRRLERTNRRLRRRNRRLRQGRPATPGQGTEPPGLKHRLSAGVGRVIGSRRRVGPWVTSGAGGRDRSAGARGA